MKSFHITGDSGVGELNNSFEGLKSRARVWNECQGGSNNP